MTQQSTPIPSDKGLGKIQWSDIWKGLIKTTGGLFLGIVVTMLRDRALPSYEHIEPLLEACVFFFAGYVGINAATNNVGQIFKKDKDVVNIDVNTLNDLKEKANL